MQDEPELATGFSRKMSLKGKDGMLGIDHQHGRHRGHQPGADSGVRGRQRRRAVCRPAARGGVRLGGTDAGATAVRQPGQTEQGAGPAIHRPHLGSEPRAGDAADHGLWQERAGESSSVSTHQVRHALHHCRRKSIGLCRQGAWQLERAGDAARPGARKCRIRPSCLPAVGGDFGGAPVPAAQLGRLPQTQCQLSAHAAHTDPHRRTTQTTAKRLSRIPTHRHRAPGRSGWPQRAVSHQRRRPGDPVGNCGRPRKSRNSG